MKINPNVIINKKGKVLELLRNEQLAFDIQLKLDGIDAVALKDLGNSLDVILCELKHTVVVDGKVHSSENSDHLNLASYYQYRPELEGLYPTEVVLGRLKDYTRDDLEKQLKFLRRINRLIKIQLGYFAFGAIGSSKNRRIALRHNIKQMNDEDSVIGLRNQNFKKSLTSKKLYHEKYRETIFCRQIE